VSVSHRSSRSALLGLAVLLAGFLPFAAGAPAARAATDHAVEIGDMVFTPAMLHVAVGDTVTWTNGDDRPHTVTAHGGGFDSGNLEPGQRYSFTFTGAGTFTYFCGYHDEMQATIVVEGAPAPASQAPAGGGAGNGAGSGTGAGAAATAEPANPASQPDTALLPAGAGPQLPALLMGLGLIVMGVSVVRAPRRALTARVPGGGWRR
jgi:plastocyanin